MCKIHLSVGCWTLPQQSGLQCPKQSFAQLFDLLWLHHGLPQQSLQAARSSRCGVLNIGNGGRSIRLAADKTQNNKPLATVPRSYMVGLWPHESRIARLRDRIELLPSCVAFDTVQAIMSLPVAHIATGTSRSCQGLGQLWVMCVSVTSSVGHPNKIGSVRHRIFRPSLPR